MSDNDSRSPLSWQGSHCLCQPTNAKQGSHCLCQPIDAKQHILHTQTSVAAP